MALNIQYSHPTRKAFTVAKPATPVSGDPVRVGGAMTGIAQNDEDADGETVVQFNDFIATFSVKGHDGSGNSAVALLDALFYVDDATPPLSKNSAGVFYGFALGVVDAGATSSIEVLHVQSPGSGTLTAGGVGTSNLADGAVTAAKLSANLKIGTIPLYLSSAREIVTNDIPNAAANGGLLAADTTPIFGRINLATDKQEAITWAASNNDAIEWSFPYPADLDDTGDVVVNLLLKSGGATDTPVMTVSYFEGIGDTNAGGNSPAITSSVSQKIVTVLAANIGAYPNVASVSVLPGAHTTDTVVLLGAWITYTRKA